MKKLIILISILFIWQSNAQQIVKESIDSGGAKATAGTGMQAIVAIGEVVNTERSNGGIHVSEGFLGPDIQAILKIENYSTMGNITVFPNPTADLVNIKLPKKVNYTIQIINLQGKIIFKKEVSNSNETTINLKGFAKSTYFIVITNNKLKLYKTMKIIKK